MPYIKVQDRTKTKSPFSLDSLKFDLGDTSKVDITTKPDLKIAESTPAIIPKKYVPVSQRFKLGEGLDKEAEVLPIPFKKSAAQARQAEIFGQEIKTSLDAPEAPLGKSVTEGNYIPVGKRIKTTSPFEDVKITDLVGDSFNKGVLETGSAIETILGVGAKKIGAEQISNKLMRLAKQDKDFANVNVQIVDERAFSEKIKDPKFIAQGVSQNISNLLFGMGVSIPVALSGGSALAIGATAFASSGMLEAGFAYQDAKEFGASDSEAEKVAVIVGVANGLLESLPITKLLSRNSAGKSLKRKIVKEIASRTYSQMKAEGVTESIQEIVSNSVAIMNYDENRSLLQGVPEAGFFGTIMGGGVSLTTDVLTNEQIKEQYKKAIESEEGFAKIPGEEKDPTQQAKSFNNVDDFISKQYKEIYHGSDVAGLEDTNLKIMESADRFVGGFGVTKKPEAIFLAEDKVFANSVGKMRSELSGMPESYLYNRYIPKDSKILDLTTPEKIDKSFKELGLDIEKIFTDAETVYIDNPKFKDLIEEGGIGMSDVVNLFHTGKYDAEKKIFINKLKELDYNVVKLKEKEGISFAVLDENILKTKQQLIDIFNKEKGKPASLSGKEQIKIREEAKLARTEEQITKESLKYKGELENQYQNFKKLVTPAKLDSISDATQLKKTIKAEPEAIYNMLYSQTLTIDEVFDMFKNRRYKELEPLTQVPKETKATVAEKARTTATQKAREQRASILAKIKVKIETVEAIKKDVVEYAKTLDLKEKGKLLATVKNAKTFKDLDKARYYIQRLGEQAESRKIINAIQKSIKQTVTKGKKPTGKYTPEIQNTLNAVKKLTDLNQKQANLKLEENLSTYAEKMPVEVAMENYILSLYTGTIEQKKELLSIINQLKEKGEIASALKKFNIQADIQAKSDLIIERVTGGKGVEAGRLKGEPLDKTAKQKIKEYFKMIGKKTILDWQGLMITSDFNTSVKAKPLSEFFSFGKNESKYKELQAKYREDFDKAISEIYGIKNKPNSILKKINKISREVVTVDKYSMTRDELIKRYIEIQDPTLIASFIEGNKYTEKTLEDIKNKMTAEDKKFAEWQIKYYGEQYEKINEVYSKMTGVNLPFNEFYSPIKRVGFDTKPGHTEFLDEAIYRKAVTSKSLISRVKNLKPIAKQASISVLDKHITDTNYYIAWAEKIRELDSIFTDNLVREAYKQELPQILSSIENKIQHIATHGNKTATRIGWVDYIRNNYVVGNLAVKPALTIKQLVSTLAYTEKISSASLISGILDFAKNPIKNYNILQNESSFIKTRGLGMERDIRDAIKEGVFDRYSKKQNLATTLLLNVKLGDKGAIVLGSWAMRKVRLKEGIKLSDIIEEYTEFGSNTQQSADISRLSEIQLGGSLEKLFTVFKSSQRAYLQKELNVVKSMFRKDGFGKDNIKKVAKTLWIYHILLPVIFQWVSNMGGWSDEDKKDYIRAGLLGSLNGLFIAGDIIDGIIRQVMGMMVWDMEVVIADIGNDINKIISNLTEYDVSTEDFQQALDAMASAGTGVTGLPLEYSYDLTESIYNGNYNTGLKQLLGWSEYVIGKPKSKSGSLEAFEERIKKIQDGSKLKDFENRIKKIQKK